MTNKTNYRRNDLIDLIQKQYKDDYPTMSGSLMGTLASVLIQVEVRNPKLFQEIIEFEIGTQKRVLTN